MAKPFLFFVLYRSGWARNGIYGMGVTSEKGGQIYGRHIGSETVTHVSVRDVIHRFPPGTPEVHVAGAAHRAAAARSAAEPAIQEARDALLTAERAAQRAVLQAAIGGEP